MARRRKAAKKTRQPRRSWTVYVHGLGGDVIHIEAAPDTAKHFMHEALGIDTDAWYEDDDDMRDAGMSGPIWSLVEGDRRDGSFSQRPQPLEQQYEMLAGGRSRTAVFDAAAVRAWRDARTPRPHAYML